MKLPFTREAFMQLFADYNHAVWPLQFYLVMVAGVILFFVYLRIEGSGKFILAVLGLLWLWMGIGYHILFFSTINTAAYFFGAAFILQAILFFYYAINRSPKFQFQFNFISIAGIAMMIFSIMIYPLIGNWAGHQYPYKPTFGVPCPTTIFTLGLLLLSKVRVPYWLVIIPLIWSLIGTSAAIKLGMTEDFGLILSALTFVLLYAFNNRKRVLKNYAAYAKDVANEN